MGNPGRVRLTASSGSGTGVLPFGTVEDLLVFRATLMPGATGNIILNLLGGASLIDRQYSELTLVPPPTDAWDDSVDGSLVIYDGVEVATKEMTKFDRVPTQGSPPVTPMLLGQSPMSTQESFQDPRKLSSSITKTSALRPTELSAVVPPDRARLVTVDKIYRDTEYRDTEIVDSIFADPELAKKLRHGWKRIPQDRAVGPRASLSFRDL